LSVLVRLRAPIWWGISMRNGLALCAFLASLAAASVAHAGMVGLQVKGTIDPDGVQADSWDIKQQTIGVGREYYQTVDGNSYGANFGANRLLITDVERPRETASGWQMTFQLLSPAEFKNVTLVSSNFGNNLTFSLVNNVLTINWTGDEAYASMTRKERRELGVERFRAMFNISTEDAVAAVPEPGTLSLVAGGILAAAAFGWRRRPSNILL
jgi:hypothetical protein